MVCILKMDGAEIAGWIIATDLDDARRQVPFDNRALGEMLDRMEFAPPPGKHVLPNGYVMLVSQ